MHLPDPRVDEVAATQQADFRAASYWMTTRDYVPGPGLAADLEVDVAIIGGGLNPAVGIRVQLSFGKVTAGR